MANAAVLAPEQRSALDRLSTCAPVASFYLAGDSALTVHLGHRQSLDLDFFSNTPEVSLTIVRDALSSAFAHVRVLGETDVALHVECDGARLDFVRYPYPALERPTPGPFGIGIAGLRDLGTMKLSALSRRGLRRDFWDLHEILRAGPTLFALGTDYVSRFGVHASDLYHVARALTYYADAEKDAAFPRGLTREHWELIKAYFDEHARELLGDESGAPLE